MRTVMQSREFAAIQAPFHLLDPSTLRETPPALCDPDYGGFLRAAHELGMGIFAIRVFAAGGIAECGTIGPHVQDAVLSVRPVPP